MKSATSPVFWVCFATTIALMGTALISPLYGLYKAAWNLRASDVSLIYVIYMLGALFSLLALGRLPDRLGYRRVLAASNILAMLGTFLTMRASGLVSLDIGRFLVGVAASLSTSAGASALRDQMPESERARVPLLYSLLMAAGFGIGPLVGGLVGQFAPMPLRVAYWPTLICGLIALIGLMFFVTERHPPEAGRPLGLGDVLPRLTVPERGRRLDFLLTCCSPLMYFIVFGFYAAMAPLFVEAILHISGPLVSGLSIMAILVLSSLVQIAIRRVPSRFTVRFGFLVLALSNAAVMINLGLNSGLLFALGVVLAAVGHGSSSLGSMQQLSRSAKGQNLAGLTSTYMVVGYAGTVIASLGLGALSDWLGLETAVMIFGGGVILCCLLFLLVTTLRGPCAL